MPFSNKKASIVVLFLCATILATACGDNATEPNVRRAASQTAHADDVTGDPLACKSGFTVVEGRIVCN